ncbi:MAG: hypothetical protein IKP54_02010 [Bacteroidales bacterium]|nr:hypothetical protein [Bacteroidota bacterium]MBQ9507988.1 hypothetical protein [Bacteroidales bacterium]MBR6062926.1 hypothetical protein [Bacteroidales bacterium]
MMKRLTLVPKTDTITICLPAEWVGKVINCTLQNTEEEEILAYPLAAERRPIYYVNKPKSRKR